MASYETGTNNEQNDPVLEDLNVEIKALDSKYETLENLALEGFPVSFEDKDTRTIDADGVALYVWDKKATKLAITWGEVQSAAMFGYRFKFGNSTTDKTFTLLPAYVTQKRAFIHIEYQRRKRELEYMKIAYKESKDPLNTRNTDVAYLAWYEDFMRDDAELNRGKLAEKMFIAAVIKECLDNHYPFSPYEPGPIEDIEYKVDLMVQGRFKDGYPFHVGIQFTTNETESGIKMKLQLSDRGYFKRTHAQAVPIEVYSLIASSTLGEIFNKVYAQWRPQLPNKEYLSIQKCDPRGPLVLLSKEEQVDLQSVTDRLVKDLHVMTTLTSEEWKKHVAE
jgi:hypothetical protein